MKVWDVYTEDNAGPGSQLYIEVERRAKKGSKIVLINEGRGTINMTVSNDDSLSWTYPWKVKGGETFEVQDLKITCLKLTFESSTSYRMLVI